MRQDPLESLTLWNPVRWQHGSLVRSALQQVSTQWAEPSLREPSVRGWALQAPVSHLHRAWSLGAGRMAQWVTWVQISGCTRSRESTPKSCPLTSTHLPWQVHYPPSIPPHTHNVLLLLLEACFSCCWNVFVSTFSPLEKSVTGAGYCTLVTHPHTPLMMHQRKGKDSEHEMSNSASEPQFQSSKC